LPVVCDIERFAAFFINFSSNESLSVDIIKSLDWNRKVLHQPGERTQTMNGRHQIALWSSALLIAGLYCLLAISVKSEPAGAAGSGETKAALGDVVPARAEPRWWKGNLHTHTYWSDGDDFPEMIAEWYRDHGYNFLALSDHNVLSEGMRWEKFTTLQKKRGEVALKKYLERFGPNWVETRGSREAGTLEVRLKPFSEYRSLVEERGRFLMIPCEEISDRAEGVPLHMNAANIVEAIQPLGGRTIREAMAANVRAAEEQAAKTGREVLIHLNHPNWHLAITAEDMAAVVSERFFEVYNGHPGVNHLGDEYHAPVERLWDIANTIRIGQLHAPPLYGVANDDCHTYHGKPANNGPGRGWIMVRATHLTPESLIRALKRADFYASSGVRLNDIDYSAARKTLTLSIEPDKRAEYTTRFIGTLAGYDATATPVTDKEGKPIRTTQKYSSDVGHTLATVTGLNPSYQLTGKELYVRAVVTSTLDPVDPSFANQKQQAWTQPVGWEGLVK
jgi:hypothetical protein